MRTVGNPNVKTESPELEAAESDLEERLRRTVSVVLRLAREAKLRHFRYFCREQSAPQTRQAFYRKLEQLEQELKRTCRHPNCEATALERLQCLVLLSEGPPHRDAATRARLGAIVRAGLSELR